MSAAPIKGAIIEDRRRTRECLAATVGGTAGCSTAGGPVGRGADVAGYRPAGRHDVPADRSPIGNICDKVHGHSKSEAVGKSLQDRFLR